MVARFFGIRNNIIVPNVSWGFFKTHEADMVIIDKAGFMTEVEIKRSWRDFLADFKKASTHDEGKVSYKYFAVPAEISGKVQQYLTEHDHKEWGVISYDESARIYNISYPSNNGYKDPTKKLTTEEQLSIARLGCMRIWSLKKKLIDKTTGK